MENQSNQNSENINKQFEQAFGNQFGQMILPNATAVLVLGIISIVGCFCYGIVGVICGIVALVLASKDFKLYNANPSNYNEASLKNLKAGKICAIIGVSLSALYILILIVYIIIAGTFISKLPFDLMGSH